MKKLNVGGTGDSLSLSPTLHAGEQKRLRSEVSNRVYHLAPHDKAARPLLFRVIHLSLKERFRVASYRDIKQDDLQAALHFISNWGNESEQKRSTNYEFINQ